VLGVKSEITLTHVLSQVARVTKGDLAGQIVVAVSKRYFRPAEVDLLHGDPSKAVKVTHF